MDTKKWYASKTLWVNILAVAGIIAQGQFGYVISPQVQAGILGGINLILRLVTKTGLEG